MTSTCFSVVRLLILLPVAFAWSQSFVAGAAAHENSQDSGNQPKKWLGHTVGASPELIGQFIPDANLVVDAGWRDYGDAVIKAARRRGLKVVLVFRSEHREEAKKKAIALARANRDTVIALSWRTAYYNGYEPEDLAEYARRVKRAVPGLQFWCEFVEKPRSRYQTKPVPPEVDTIVVNCYFDRTPGSVDRKTRDTLPGWLEKAKGRPVLLHWLAWEKRPPGLIAKCDPGTMRECAKVAEKYNLSGLILGHYGIQWGCEGLETRPRLVAEIRGLAKDFGAARVQQPLAADSVRPQTASKIAKSEKAPGQNSDKPNTTAESTTKSDSNADLTNDGAKLEKLEKKLKPMFTEAHRSDKGQKLFEKMDVALFLMRESSKRISNYGSMSANNMSYDMFGRPVRNPTGIGGIARRVGNAAATVTAKRNHRLNRLAYNNAIFNLAVYHGDYQWKSLTPDEVALIERITNNPKMISEDDFPNIYRLSMHQVRKKITTLKKDTAGRIERAKLYAKINMPVLAVDDLETALDNNPTREEREEASRLLAKYRERL